MTMNAKELKIKLLHYWRFNRRYLYIATEVGKFNADVLASNGIDTIVECEVKTSKRDLVNDFKKKKHRIFQSPSQWYASFMPNYFFFAVPSKLLDDALDLTKDTPYGVIEVFDITFIEAKQIRYCVIRRNASLLTEKFRDKLFRQLVLRMGSEIVRSRISLKENNVRFIQINDKVHYLLNKVRNS